MLAPALCLETPPGWCGADSAPISARTVSIVSAFMLALALCLVWSLQLPYLSQDSEYYLCLHAGTGTVSGDTPTLVWSRQRLYPGEGSEYIIYECMQAPALCLVWNRQRRFSFGA